MSNPHAEWFADLGRDGSPQLVVQRHADGWSIWMRVDGPIGTETMANAFSERAQQRVVDLIDTAPGAIDGAQG